MVGQGYVDKKNISLHISTFFTPIFQKNQLPRYNSLCSSSSGIPCFCLQKVHIGRGFENISSATKNRDFCKKKWGVFFDIVKPL